jgi:alpha-tubulin suppressor-like RCC1 family protein
MGALGHGSYSQQDTPKEIELLTQKALMDPSHQVVSVAAGWGNSTVLTRGGDVVDWGWVYDLTQILRISRMYRYNRVFKKVATNVQKLRLGSLFLDLAQTSPARLEVDSEIIGVSCGAAFGAAVDNQGRAWAWGDPTHSQLGLGSSQDIQDPQLIPHFLESGIQLKSVACGFTHLLLLSDSGEVYALGKIDSRALGVGSSESYSRKGMFDQPGGTPISWSRSTAKLASTSLQRPGKIIEIQAGMNTSIALTEEGELFTCGVGTSGSLGHPSFTDELFPRKLDAFDGEKILQFSMGMYHCAAITESRRLFTWGLGTDGQCARHRLEASPNPRSSQMGMSFGSRTVSFLPGIVSCLPSQFVPKKVCCGLYYTVVIPGILLSHFSLTQMTRRGFCCIVWKTPLGIGSRISFWN